MPRVLKEKRVLIHEDFENVGTGGLRVFEDIVASTYTEPEGEFNAESQDLGSLDPSSSSSSSSSDPDDDMGRESGLVLDNVAHDPGRTSAQPEAGVDAALGTAFNSGGRANDGSADTLMGTVQFTKKIVLGREYYECDNHFFEILSNGNVGPEIVFDTTNIPPGLSSVPSVSSVSTVSTEGESQEEEVPMRNQQLMLEDTDVVLRRSARQLDISNKVNNLIKQLENVEKGLFGTEEEKKGFFSAIYGDGIERKVMTCGGIFRAFSKAVYGEGADLHSLTKFFELLMLAEGTGDTDTDLSPRNRDTYKRFVKDATYEFEAMRSWIDMRDESWRQKSGLLTIPMNLLYQFVCHASSRHWREENIRSTMLPGHSDEVLNKFDQYIVTTNQLDKHVEDKHVEDQELLKNSLHGYLRTVNRKTYEHEGVVYAMDMTTGSLFFDESCHYLPAFRYIEKPELLIYKPVWMLTKKGKYTVNKRRPQEVRAYHNILLAKTNGQSEAPLHQLEHEHIGELVAKVMRPESSRQNSMEAHAQKMELKLCDQLGYYLFFEKGHADCGLASIRKKKINYNRKKGQGFYHWWTLYCDYLEWHGLKWGDQDCYFEILSIWSEINRMTLDERDELEQLIKGNKTEKKKPKSLLGETTDSSRATAKIVEAKRKREEDAAAAKQEREKQAKRDAKNKSPRSAAKRPPTPEEYVEIPDPKRPGQKKRVKVNSTPHRQHLADNPKKKRKQR
eukprot:SAG11_NODE_2794_length_2963_cov_33.731494_3_plen_730_part_00